LKIDDKNHVNTNQIRTKHSEKMKKLLISLLLLFPVLTRAQEDCAEPSYLNRIEGFDLASCKFSEFNEYEFQYYDLKGNYITMKKGGVYHRLNYTRNEDDTRNLSGAYIKQNYLNAVLKAKGENLSREKDVFKFRHEDKIIYMMIENAVDDDDRGYQVYIIEETEMKQEIELSIKEAMAQDGKMALYGIFFDTDKSVIKPESEKELALLVTYLNENPAVNLYVVGHTDNTGDFAHNLKLSKDRAASIVAYLVVKGIKQSRLSADGVGPLCPVTSNKQEEGRKKNRRVEIVLK